MKMVVPKITGAVTVGKREAQETPPVENPDDWGDPFQEGRVTGKDACGPLPPENKPEYKALVLITDLDDISYSIVKPIPIIVQEFQDEGYWLVECALEGSLCWSGGTQEEAIEGLKGWLTDSFDLFERLELDGARLGPDMVSQRDLLRSHIQRSHS